MMIGDTVCSTKFLKTYRYFFVGFLFRIFTKGFFLGYTCRLKDRLFTRSVFAFPVHSRQRCSVCFRSYS